MHGSEGSSVARCAPPRSPPSVPRAGGANPLALHEAKRACPPRHAARGRGAPTRLLEHDVRPCVKQNNFFYCHLLRRRRFRRSIFSRLAGRGHRQGRSPTPVASSVLEPSWSFSTCPATPCSSSSSSHSSAPTSRETSPRPTTRPAAWPERRCTSSTRTRGERASDAPHPRADAANSSPPAAPLPAAAPRLTPIGPPFNARLTCTGTMPTASKIRSAMRLKK